MNIELNSYALPEPLQGDDLKAAAQAALELINICPAKPKVGTTMLAAVARAPLCEAMMSNFLLFFHGKTGSYKTEVSKLLLNFFGNFQNPTAGWRDTRASIPKRTFQCKDVPLVLDDFKLGQGNKADADLKERASSIIQAIGDGVGRNKLNAESANTKTYHHRGMVIGSGEHFFDDSANLGRSVVLELSEGDTTLEEIIKMKAYAREGLFTGLMSAYIQWLASRMDSYKTIGRKHGLFQSLFEDYRNQVHGEAYTKSHSRAASNYANMVAALELFFNFLVECGAVAVEQHEQLFSECKGHLQAALLEQREYVADSDKVELFFTLLRSVFSEHNAHLKDAITMKEPANNPYAFGWSNAEIKGIEAMHDQYITNSDCIGYHNAKDQEVWLVPASAYKVVNRMAMTNGEFLPSKLQLFKEMQKRGHIKECAPGRPTKQKRIPGSGSTEWVLIVPEKVILGELLTEPPQSS